MPEKLGWKIRGEQFEDGSLLEDWIKIEESGAWHWQYDTHELTFDIYEYNGCFWKLYRVRYPSKTRDSYQYDYGGQACQVVLVAYRHRISSPHSNKVMQPGDLEWIRVGELDPAHQTVIRRNPQVMQAGLANTSMQHSV